MLDTLVQGLLLGGLYALFALGLSVMFGVMRLTNIAQGDFIVMAAFGAVALASLLGPHPLWIAIVLLPLAFWLGHSWVETTLLAGTVLLVMIVELLNTGIETAIDRIGPEWHDLSKRAKDMGSAAVLLSLLLCSGTWLAALWQRWIA